MQSKNTAGAPLRVLDLSSYAISNIFGRRILQCYSETPGVSGDFLMIELGLLHLSLDG